MTAHAIDYTKRIPNMACLVLDAPDTGHIPKKTAKWSRKYQAPNYKLARRQSMTSRISSSRVKASSTKAAVFETQIRTNEKIRTMRSL